MTTFAIVWLIVIFALLVVMNIYGYIQEDTHVYGISICSITILLALLAYLIIDDDNRKLDNIKDYMNGKQQIEIIYKKIPINTADSVKYEIVPIDTILIKK
jgi:hypothetical protein